MEGQGNQPINLIALIQSRDYRTPAPPITDPQLLRLVKNLMFFISNPVDALTYFPPDTLPNVSIWFDATKTDTITISEGTVVSWANQGTLGGSTNLLQGMVTTSGSINGSPAIRYEPYGQSGWYGSLPSYDKTTFCVFKNLIDLKQLQLPYCDIFNGPTQLGSAYDSGSDSFLYSIGSRGLWLMYGYGINPSNGPILLASRITSNNLNSNKITINGQPITLVENHLGYFDPTPYLFYSGRQDGISVDIGEIIVYERALSDTDMNRVTSSLAAKWGINTEFNVNNSIPNVVLWMDANDSSTMAFDQSNNLIQWNDKSIEQNHMVHPPEQYGSEYGALTQLSGGLTALNFQRWNMRTTNLLNTNMFNDNYFLVVHPIIVDGYSFFLINDIDGQRQIAFIDQSLPCPIYVFSPFMGSSDSGVNLMSNEPVLIEVIRSSLTYTTSLYINGKLVSSSYLTSVAGQSLLYLGSANGDANYVRQFLMCELIVTSGILTDAARISLEQYLIKKWGIVTGFDVRKVANVVLWLDGNDTTTMTFSSGNLIKWADKSFERNVMSHPLGQTNAISGTLTKVRGNTAINFNRWNMVTSNVLNVDLLNDNYFLVVVPIQVDGYTFFFINNVDGSRQLFLNGFGFPTPVWYVSPQIVSSDYGVNLEPNRPVLIEILNTSQTYSSAMYINGKFLGSTYISMPAANSQLVLGSGTDGFTFDIQYMREFNMCELIVTSGHMGEAAQKQIEDYLMRKWNIPKPLY